MSNNHFYMAAPLTPALASIAPQSVADLIWVVCSALALLFLNDMRTTLREIKSDLKTERDKRERLEIEFSEHKARCQERHKDG